MIQLKITRWETVLDYLSGCHANTRVFAFGEEKRRRIEEGRGCIDVDAG